MYSDMHSVNISAHHDDPPPEESRFFSSGEFSAWMGWSLVLAAFAMAVGLDPWSLSERDAAVWLGSPQMYARHAQAVLLGMGFLNLAVARILRRASPASQTSRVIGLVGFGTTVYCLSYLFGVAWPIAHYLVPLGAVANLAGFSLWLWALRRETVPLLFRRCIDGVLFRHAARRRDGISCGCASIVAA